MIDEKQGIIKDSSPYLIFKCQKCGQYMYVKPTQKTKKCLRCGSSYKMSKINQQLKVEEVEGMSNAVERVKELQNELARDHLGKDPTLKTPNTFSIASKFPGRFEKIEQRLEMDPKLDKTLENRFKELLSQLSKKFNTFPKYLIELASSEFGIDPSDLDLLIRRFIKNGALHIISGNYYQFEASQT